MEALFTDAVRRVFFISMEKSYFFQCRAEILCYNNTEYIEVNK